MINYTYLECDARQNWTGPVLGLDAPLSLDPKSEEGQIVGYVACLIACLFFGSNFVPYKFVRTGDGFFCQWIMCSTVLIVGLIIQLIRQQPIFFSLNLVGGSLWCIGNCCVVPIINLIGLSIGMLLWNTSNVLSGWATGRFGLFVCAQVPANEAFNYAGVALCVAAGAVYVFVKTDTVMHLPRCLKRFEDPDPESQPEGANNPEDDLRLNTSGPAVVTSSSQRLLEPEEKKETFLPNLPPVWRKVLAIALSVGSGLCYGVQFLPSGYIQDHTIVDGARASQNGLDYVFAQFCGTYIASTVFFVVYVAIFRRQAYVDVKLVLPAVLSGFVWAIATCCFFIGNSTLSQAITFPIIATVPGMIAALWGIFLFGEVSGLRNFLILGLAFAMTITGAVLTALSKL